MEDGKADDDIGEEANEEKASATGTASPNNTNTAKTAVNKRERRFSIANLGLDVKAAQNIPHNLFPIAIRQAHKLGFGKTYPLPSSVHELAQLCELVAKSGSIDDAAVYIRRARKRYMEKVRAKSRGQIDVEKERMRTYMAGYRFNKDLKRNKAEVHQEMERFRTEVARATASLASLYDKSRKVAEMQLDGYIAGADVNGEQISAAQAMNTVKSIFSHTARIGMPSEQVDEAEDAIFEELAKAKKKTREAIAAQLPDETEH